MRPALRIGCLAACAIVALGATSAAARAVAGGHPTCSARHVLIRTATLLVFEKLTSMPDNSGAGNETGVYVCARPDGRARLIGYDDIAGNQGDSEYGGDDALLTVKVAAHYVAAQFSSGEDSTNECYKYNIGGVCPPPVVTIDVVSAFRGRSVAFQLSDANGTSVPMAISPAGALAWIDDRGLLATALRPRGASLLRGRPTVLDTHAGGPVSITGPTVHWFDRANGEPVARSEPVPE